MSTPYFVLTASSWTSTIHGQTMRFQILGNDVATKQMACNFWGSRPRKPRFETARVCLPVHLRRLDLWQVGRAMHKATPDQNKFVRSTELGGLGSLVSRIAAVQLSVDLPFSPRHHFLGHLDR